MLRLRDISNCAEFQSLLFSQGLEFHFEIKIFVEKHFFNYLVVMSRIGDIFNFVKARKSLY